MKTTLLKNLATCALISYLVQTSHLKQPSTSANLSCMECLVSKVPYEGGKNRTSPTAKKDTGQPIPAPFPQQNNTHSMSLAWIHPKRHTMLSSKKPSELTGMPAMERFILADRNYLRWCRVLGLCIHFDKPNSSDLVRQNTRPSPNVGPKK